MALTDAATMQTISDALGAADANLQATLDVNTSTTAAAKIKTVRQTVHTQTAEADIDDATSWQTVMRNLEKSLPTSVNPLLTSACSAIDTYMVSQTGKKMREQFKTGVTWATNFRTLWRRVKSEELIVRLGSMAKATGVWGSWTPDQTISLDTALEVRLTAGVGASSIALTITVSKSGGSTDVISLTIPANTVITTTYSLASSTATKFNGVVSVSATGGSNGDGFEIWTK